MPYYDQVPPVKGAVQLTEDEIEAIKKNAQRPFYMSQRTNQRRQKAFGETAAQIGSDILYRTIGHSTSVSLDAERIGPALGLVTEIAYDVASTQVENLGPTRIMEFTAGAIQGAMDAVRQRQAERFGEMLSAGIHG